MAKGYWITWYQSSVDPAVHAKYSQLAGSAIESAGGRFLARGVSAAAYEGGTNQRCVLVEFDSVAQAIAAYESSAYREALTARDGSAQREVRIVEGQ